MLEFLPEDRASPEVVITELEKILQPIIPPPALQP